MREITIETSTSAATLNPSARMQWSNTHSSHVRIYPESPGRLALQIRSHGKLSDHATKPRHAYSHAHLDLEAARQIRAALNDWIAEQERGESSTLPTGAAGHDPEAWKGGGA